MIDVQKTIAKTMKNVIKPFILLSIFTLTLSSFGQRVRYKDIKNEISIKDYNEKITNAQYSPVLAGTCNYLLPSSGYFYVGEPLRGVCVLGGELVTGSVLAYGIMTSMSANHETGEAPKGARAVLISGFVATSLLHLWSVYDVVRIAKIKNIAYQNKQISLMAKPNMFIVSMNDRNYRVCGITLSVNF